MGAFWIGVRSVESVKAVQIVKTVEDVEGVEIRGTPFSVIPRLDRGIQDRQGLL